MTIISDPTNLSSSSSYTQAGTTRWMSPELIDPQRFGFEKSRRTTYSDCYALGMVIYETVSGRFPFHRHGDYAVILKVLAGEHPPRGVGFSEDMWKMLELCWATQPDDRPGAKDVLQCLERVSDLSEPPSPRAGRDTETDSYDWDSLEGSSGMFPHFAPLQFLAFSVHSVVIGATISLHSYAPSVLSESVYSTDNLDATEQNDDPGLSTNGNLTSDAHLPQVPPYPPPLPLPRPPLQTGFRRVRDASELHPITTRPQTGRRMDGNGIYLSVRTLTSISLVHGAIPGLSVRLTDGIVRNFSLYDNWRRTWWIHIISATRNSDMNQYTTRGECLQSPASRCTTMDTITKTTTISYTSMTGWAPTVVTSEYPRWRPTLYNSEGTLRKVPDPGHYRSRNVRANGEMSEYEDA